MKELIFETKEQYLNAIQAWKESCKEKDFQFSAEHFALYAIIRDKDPINCFASPEKQSQKKLSCQRKDGWEAYNQAMRIIESGYSDARLLSPFKGTLTVIQLMRLREIMEDETVDDSRLQRLGAK